MSYRFYSSDPFLVATNFGFATTGAITNLQQYSNLVSQVSSYASSMSQTNAKISGYVLYPLWSAPGLPAELGGDCPPQVNPANYDNFLQSYSALQAWKQGLEPWILDGNALSWLNDQGRQLVQTS